jgi:hypothetical protein
VDANFWKRLLGSAFEALGYDEEMVKLEELDQMGYHFKSVEIHVIG